MRVVPAFITRVCKPDVARLISPAVLVCGKFSAASGLWPVAGPRQIKCRHPQWAGTARPGARANTCSVEAKVKLLTAAWWWIELGWEVVPTRDASIRRGRPAANRHGIFTYIACHSSIPT